MHTNSFPRSPLMLTLVICRSVRRSLPRETYYWRVQLPSCIPGNKYQMLVSSAGSYVLLRHTLRRLYIVHSSEVQ